MRGERQHVLVREAAPHDFRPDGRLCHFPPETRDLRRRPQCDNPGLTECRVDDSEAAWELSDQILFQTEFGGAVASVPASGGDPQVLLKPDLEHGERGLLWPQPVGSDGSVLFTVYESDVVSMNDARIAVGRPGDPRGKRVLTGGTFGRYLPTGHLVYGYDGKLMGVSFNVQRLTLGGAAVPVLDGVSMSPLTGRTEFAVSDTGDLFYVAGAMQSGKEQLALIDRAGRVDVVAFGTGAEAAFMTSPRFSPDGTRVAVCVHKANDDIHVYNLVSETMARATFEGGDERSPVWMNDSARLVYTSEPGMAFKMLVKDVDAGAASTAMFPSANPRYASSVSPDGRVLAFEENNPSTGWDIWTGPVDGAAEARPFLNTRYSESFPTFSPDGKWIAYQSDESGDPEIYVVKYPGPGGKRQVSQAGGIQPVWDAQGKELFYLSGNRLMAVETTFTPTLRLGPPKTIFSTDGLLLKTEAPWRTYSVSPDGGRFAFMKIVPSTPVTSLQVVVNWLEELKAKVPVK